MGLPVRSQDGDLSCWRRRTLPREVLLWKQPTMMNTNMDLTVALMRFRMEAIKKAVYRAFTRDKEYINNFLDFVRFYCLGPATCQTERKTVSIASLFLYKTKRTYSISYHRPNKQFPLSTPYHSSTSSMSSSNDVSSERTSLAVIKASDSSTLSKSSDRRPPAPLSFTLVTSIRKSLWWPSKSPLEVRVPPPPTGLTNECFWTLPTPAPTPTPTGDGVTAAGCCFCVMPMPTPVLMAGGRALVYAGAVVVLALVVAVAGRWTRR
mmetsp:Transcript_23089/g.66652  ORF Transcript_23089/g.66652 Transcript_23089/m.66652 type:complete len:264 (-) Transcript_23089:745-1536(-)